MKVNRVRTHKVIQPRPPWEFRSKDKETKRTLLTNVNFPSHTGKIDPLLRLYQHYRDVPFQTLDGVECAVYASDEWLEIVEWVDWLELIGPENIWRASIKDAKSKYIQKEYYYVPKEVYTES